MRAGFGLVSLLVTLGIIAILWRTTTIPTLQQGMHARSEAEQIAGIDQSGVRVTKTVVFQPVVSQGRLLGLQVQTMQPGSSYGSFYGIAPGDVIETIGPQTVRDIGDEETAKALAYEAYQRQWDLGIIRNNRKYVLPGDAAMAANPLPSPAAQTAAGANAAPGVQAAANSPAAQPGQAAGQPAADPQKTGSPLYDQLNAIRNYNQEK